jgi:hypothetical protein
MSEREWVKERSIEREVLREEEVADLLACWFDTEFAVRTSHFGEGRNLQQQREEAEEARKALAHRLHETFS